jgi:hypothetical protein
MIAAQSSILWRHAGDLVTRLRPVLGNLALAALSLALVLLALEAALRLTRRQQGFGKEEATLDRYSEHDPVLGWRKRPGARATYHRREYTVEVAINSLGLRDPERGYEPAPGTFRILALGDSFVEGYGVPLAATVTQVLEKSLTSPGCPVEVINGATSAYSTDQEYLFYREEGARYGPRVVALFFYYNDVYFNSVGSYFGSPKPRLVFKGPRPELRRPVPEPEPPETRPAESEPPSSASALVGWIRDRLMRGAPRTYDALARVGLWDPIRVVPPRMEMKVYKRKPTPEIEAAWEATSRILLALRDEVASHGARLVLLYVPSRMEVSDADWELTRIRYGLDEKWDRGLVLERLRPIVGEAHIPLLDLTPALRREDGGVLGGPYYRYDGHWNALGHRVAAREVGRFLRGLQPIATCAERK